MSNNKQSSVEFLFDQLEEKGSNAWENANIRRIKISIDVMDYRELKRQAEEMHKKENYESWCKGREKLIEENRLRNNGEIVSCADFYKDSKKNFEEWYSETFGGNNEQQ